MQNKENKSNVELSKILWQAAELSNAGYPGNENITIGCLQRIAAATEAMAKNHIQLQSEYEWMKNSRDAWMKKGERLERANAALRGHLNRLKKQMKTA